MASFTHMSKLLALAAITISAVSAGAGAQGYALQPHTGQPGNQVPATQNQTQAQNLQSPRDIRDFRIVNASRAVIQGAWISLPTRRAPWVRIDLSSPIGPDGVREIGMSGWRGSQCYFDVKVDFDNGRSAHWSNVNLCRVTNLET